MSDPNRKRPGRSASTLSGGRPGTSRPTNVVTGVGRAFNWAPVKPVPTTRLRFLPWRWRAKRGEAAFCLLDYGTYHQQHSWGLYEVLGFRPGARRLGKVAGGLDAMPTALD